jgi:predicted amidohydrolase
VLLAAARCAKGDLDANLATHRVELGRASTERVDLVVFPEMSLTGSVDPVRRPDRLVKVDDAAVAQLVDATRASRATVSFGIAERAGDHAYITQCVAHDGALLGCYRKRVLGEDEEGFAVGDAPWTFAVDGVDVGLMICAESTTDAPIDAMVDAGAKLVCFSAAPGLYGRRTTDAARAEGHAWWESTGLADARRHARRRGVWIALATQAGATADEDFPGIAALVDPRGDVVARTPDWNPATLVVDVPL